MRLLFLLSIIFLSNSVLAAVTKDSPKLGIQSYIVQALSLNDLNAEQRVKIKEILAKRELKTSNLQENASEAMKDFLKSATDQSLQKDKLLTKSRKAKSSYEMLRDYQLETWLQIRGLLKENQIQVIQNESAQFLN
jgi:hypothetical protein